MVIFKRLRAVGMWLPVILSLLAGGPAQAQSKAADFHAKVAALYGFHPRDLNTAQIEAKSKELDAFWSQATADKSRTLPWLREALANVADGNFFAYDGAKLLLSLSTDRPDRELALAAVLKVDLRDVEQTDYVRTVQRFASQGLDTRAAAFRILSDPEFKAIVPLHALTLGQNYALIYMLFPMEDIPFEIDLARRLDTERDTQAQKSLLLALWYTVTPAGSAALKTFSERRDVDPAAADYARKLLASAPGPTFTLSSADSLRKERSRVMRRPISDEALIEFDSLTLKLLSKR